MSWRVRWTERALRDADGLDRSVRSRILSAIERLSQTEHVTSSVCGVDDQSGASGVGSWRVIFERDEDEIAIVRIAHRSKAYR